MFEVRIVWNKFVAVFKHSAGVFPAVDRSFAFLLIEQIDGCVIDVFRIARQRENKIVAVVCSNRPVGILQRPAVPYV